jgi:hypothetical protein
LRAWFKEEKKCSAYLELLKKCHLENWLREERTPTVLCFFSTSLK